MKNLFISKKGENKNINLMKDAAFVYDLSEFSHYRVQIARKFFIYTNKH